MLTHVFPSSPQTIFLLFSLLLANSSTSSCLCCLEAEPAFPPALFHFLFFLICKFFFGGHVFLSSVPQGGQKPALDSLPGGICRVLMWVTSFGVFLWGGRPSFSYSPPPPDCHSFFAFLFPLFSFSSPPPKNLKTWLRHNDPFPSIFFSPPFSRAHFFYPPLFLLFPNQPPAFLFTLASPSFPAFLCLLVNSKTDFQGSLRFLLFLLVQQTFFPGQKQIFSPFSPEAAPSPFFGVSFGPW